MSTEHECVVCHKYVCDITSLHTLILDCMCCLGKAELGAMLQCGKKTKHKNNQLFLMNRGAINTKKQKKN